MKKSVLILLLFFFLLWFTGCSQLKIEFQDYTVLTLGESLPVSELSHDTDINWESSNEEVIKIDNEMVKAVGAGYANIVGTIDGKEVKLTLIVKEVITKVSITGNANLNVNQSKQFYATVYPKEANQTVTWNSSDETVATVNSHGLVMGLSEGITTIEVTSSADPTKISEFTIMVSTNYEKELDDDIINNIITDHKELNLATLSGVLKPIIETTSETVIGVSNYVGQVNNYHLSSLGSGVIYRRDIVLEDGSILQNDFETIDNIDYFRYYVITNRHVVEGANLLKIYYSPDKEEIPAQLIQYDDKIDLAVISFESPFYFPIAKLGDSKAIKTGEIVLTIGHSNGYEYFRTTTLGIVSYPERYLHDDTDGDGVNDWDAEYIQHDAPINEGNSGGPIINLKGEVIGINTLKYSALLVDNLGFAIPSNLVKDIVAKLEVGEKPQRALLGVNVVDVKAILSNRTAFPESEYFIPDGVKYGLFVKDVTVGGVAYAAGIKPNDIIVSFNNVEIRYTYLLRAELGVHIIGSGDIVPMCIYRNGEEITINVIF